MKRVPSQIHSYIERHIQMGVTVFFFRRVHIFFRARTLNGTPALGRLFENSHDAICEVQSTPLPGLRHGHQSGPLLGRSLRTRVQRSSDGATGVGCLGCCHELPKKKYPKPSFAGFAMPFCALPTFWAGFIQEKSSLFSPWPLRVWT